MIKFTIGNTKDFMSALLKEETFDFFELNEISLTTFVTYNIYGKLNKEFFEDEKEEIFTSWSSVKPFVFEIIKGKKLPKHIKLILTYPENKVEEVVSGAASLSMTIVFKDGEISITTGSSMKVFSLLSSGKDWDRWVVEFLKSKKLEIVFPEIEYEE